jgi:hypothetical protein
MSKYDENPKLLSNLKGGPPNKIEMAVAGALRVVFFRFPKPNLQLTYGTKRNSKQK